MTQNAQHATDPLPLWAQDDHKVWAKFRPKIGIFMLVLAAVTPFFRLHHLTGRWEWLQLEIVFLGLLVLSGPPDVAQGWRRRLSSSRNLLTMIVGLAAIATAILGLSDSITRSLTR